jgi:hypothetical protein
MNSAHPTAMVLGFLTVRPTADQTLRAGYLLTTPYGRPIEFHYTADFRLRGPQRLLFGAKIDEYVEVDLLAVPLVERQSVAPRIVVVDRPALLELRTRIPAPLVLLEAASDADLRWNVTTHSSAPQDREEFEAIRELAPPNFDWLEPFERLTAALAETREQRSAA